VPIPSDIGHTYRVRGAAVYARGRAVTTRIETRLGADKVAPSSGVFTLTAPDASTVSTGSVTVSSSVATYSIPAGDLPSSLAYGGGYRERWKLTFSDGTVTEGQRPAYLAREPLYCPVTQADLDQQVPGLASLLGASTSNLQGWIDLAWGDTLERLIQGGQWPDAIVDVDGLAHGVRALALAYTYEAFATASPDYAITAATYRTRAESALGAVRYRIDSDQDGYADEERRHGTPVMRRSSPRIPWTYGARKKRIY
jgi:hypothetical protein